MSYKFCEKSINFSGLTCCHDIQEKYDFYKDVRRKQKFCYILQTITDIIAIFSGVYDIYTGIVSVKFYAIPPQKIVCYWDFLAFVDI